MSFRISLSGMNAAQADLNVTSNNIANSNTTGFKQSRAEFADVYPTSAYGLSKNTVGAGVRLQRVAQQFSQGTVENTGKALDLAINGKGFFTLSSGGSLVYSRAGADGRLGQAVGRGRHHVGELGARLLEAGRVGVGDVVGRDVEVGRGRVHAAERNAEGHGVLR